MRESLWRFGFDALWRLDEMIHRRGFTWRWLCRWCGRNEPRYFEGS